MIWTHVSWPTQVMQITYSKLPTCPLVGLWLFYLNYVSPNQSWEFWVNYGIKWFFFGLHIISCNLIRWMKGMFVCNKILVFNCCSEEQHSCKGCTFMFVSSFVVYVGMHERPTTLVMHNKKSHILGLDFPTLPPPSLPLPPQRQHLHMHMTSLKIVKWSRIAKSVEHVITPFWMTSWSWAFQTM